MSCTQNGHAAYMHAHMHTNMHTLTHSHLHKDRDSSPRERDPGGTWHSFIKSTRSHWPTLSLSKRGQRQRQVLGEGVKLTDAEGSQTKVCSYQRHTDLEVTEPRETKKICLRWLGGDRDR